MIHESPAKNELIGSAIYLYSNHVSMPEKWCDLLHHDYCRSRKSRPRTLNHPKSTPFAILLQQCRRPHRTVTHFPYTDDAEAMLFAKTAFSIFFAISIPSRGQPNHRCLPRPG